MAQYQDLRKIHEWTPEQQILINWFWSTFNSGEAGRRIVAVEPLYYQGVIAGSEFLTYAATKLYLCLNSYFSFSTGVEATNPGSIGFYNELNALSLFGINCSPFLNTVPAIRHDNNSFYVKNIYFSRFLNVTLTYVMFTGYRITLI